MHNLVYTHPLPTLRRRRRLFRSAQADNIPAIFKTDTEIYIYASQYITQMQGISRYEQILSAGRARSCGRQKWLNRKRLANTKLSSYWGIVSRPTKVPRSFLVGFYHRHEFQDLNEHECWVRTLEMTGDCLRTEIRYHTFYMLVAVFRSSHMKRTCLTTKNTECFDI